MNSVALEVIDEFLRSSNAQERSNACTALAALGTDESIARLIRTAVAESEPSVRTRAEAELARLHGPQATQAAGQLSSALSVRESEADIYALLARLASRGWHTLASSSTGRLPNRLRRAIRLMLSTPFRARSVMRLVWLSFPGILVTSMVLFPYLTLSTGGLPEFGDVALIVFLGWLLSGAVIFGAFSRSLPLKSHFDGLAAMSIDLLTVGTASAVTAAAGLSLFVLADGGSSASVWHIVSLVLLAAAVGVTTRAGVFVVSGLYQTPFNLVLQTFVGFVCGTATAVVGAVPPGALRGDRLTNLMVGPLVVAAAGLAFAAAWFDSEPPPERPFPHRIGLTMLIACGVLVLAAVGWGTMLAMGARSPAQPLVPVELTAASSGAVSEKLVTRDALPVQVKFGVNFPQRFAAGVRHSQGYDLTLRLQKDTGEDVDKYDDPDPPRLDLFLQPGHYLLTLGLFNGPMTRDPSADSLRASRKLNMWEVLPALTTSRGPFVMTVTLNGDKAANQK
jgi:hypothetical protein